MNTPERDLPAQAPVTDSKPVSGIASPPSVASRAVVPSTMRFPHSFRILVVDDNPAIHDDFQKILSPPVTSTHPLAAFEAKLFGDADAAAEVTTFEITHAFQGEEAAGLVRQALSEGKPFAMAFVDIRMPPGWDGLETVGQLHRQQPDLQVVLCTAYADYSWDDIQRELGRCDSLLILKKPFDSIEALQLAHALTHKWALAEQTRALLADFEQQVRLRTSELDHATAQLKREIQEREQTEAILRQAQKMDAVGQLASGVAHDFNNLLTVIQGHVGLASAAPNLPGELLDSFKQIAGAADRASGLTRQLLAFGRKQLLQPRTLNLGGLISDISKMLRRLIGEHIELKCESASTEPIRVFADAGGLEQIVFNLAVNGRDAMPNGGQLFITSELLELSADSVSHNPEARAGRFACLTVTDTGCGMDTATRERIFEPFFTTKPVGKGTGLGLATVYGIVKQHEGWIEVKSTPGQGSSFKVFLPESLLPETRSHETSLLFQHAGAGETVLVVEDEDTVREMEQMVLSAHGYRVLTARHGVEALTVWQTQRGRVDLLLSDIVMPEGISGLELARQLRSCSPELKVVFTSGYSEELLSQGPQILHGAMFLPKPYRPDRLLQTVKKCFSAPTVQP